MTTATLLELLTFPRLAALPGIAHGVTTRAGGVSPPPFASLNLSISGGDSRENVAENRRRVREALGAERLSHQNQVHGSEVLVLDGSETETPGHDAQLTATPGLALLTLGADCPGLLACDPVRRVVGVAHAGWRGAVGGVVPRWIEAFGERFGSRPEDLVVGIGPGIGPCCYEVGPNVIARARRWDGADAALLVAGRRCLFSIRTLLRHQLEALGVGAVDELDLCTACHPKLLYSHRQSGGRTGRFGLGIVLRR